MISILKGAVNSSLGLKLWRKAGVTTTHCRMVREVSLLVQTRKQIKWVF